MWFKQYQDYPIDTPVIQEPVESGRGIIGCEMHEIYGWGSRLHVPIKRPPGFIRQLLQSLLRRNS